MMGPVPPPHGGIATVMDAIARSNLAQQYQFDVFERQHILYTRANGFCSKNIFRIKRFLRFFFQLIKNRYDFVHMHSDFNGGFSGTIIFMLLARAAGTKIILHLHGTDWDTWYTKAAKWKQFRNRIALRIPQFILVLYKVWEEEIKKLVPNARIAVLANTLQNVREPSQKMIDDIRSKLELRPDNLVVLTVGFVGWRKGSYEILDAVPLVVSSFEQVKFILVGGNEFPGDMDPILKRVQQENLERWVVLPGEVSGTEIPAYLGCADVFLLPSHIEGMPMSILEAMRQGIPVISTKVGGIPEMIDDQNTGILIEPGQPEQIASSVIRLLKDATLRTAIGTAGKRKFETEFEIDNGVSGLKVIYQEVCD